MNWRTINHLIDGKVEYFMSIYAAAVFTALASVWTDCAQRYFTKKTYTYIDLRSAEHA